MVHRLKFDEIVPGFRYSTPGIVVTEAHIVCFAGIGGDFFDLHMDDTFAVENGFRSRVAHGLLGLTLVDGLKNRSQVQFDALASLEWQYKFVEPVYCGDRIHSEIEVIEVRKTRDGIRGIVKLGFSVLNQRQVVVQEGFNVLMINV